MTFTCSFRRVRSQDLKKAGGLKEWDNCKRPWPEFSLFLNPNHTVYPKLRRIFRPKSEIQTVFQPKNRWSPKKKKVSTEIGTVFSAKIGMSNGFSGQITATTSQLRHPNSFGGGCFHFFSKNRPQKHLKRAILHTLQANGGARAPPPRPSGYATLLFPN